MIKTILGDFCFKKILIKKLSKFMDNIMLYVSKKIFKMQFKCKSFELDIIFC